MFYHILFPHACHTFVDKNPFFDTINTIKSKFSLRVSPVSRTYGATISFLFRAPVQGQMTQPLYYSLINEKLPNLFFHNVEHAGGQFNDVLIVNGEWVFRFPRYREGVANLLAETRLLEALQGRLSLEIPRPLVKGFEYKVPGLTFTGHRLVKGEPLDPQGLSALPAEQQEKLAGQLAEFLCELHHVDLAHIPLLLPGAGPQEGTAIRIVQDRREVWEGMFADVRGKLFPAMRPDARREVAEHFEAYLDEPKLHDFPPCLRHGDFGGSNILWIPSLGRATGVIDFSFCAVGDAAVDLASISTLGDSFFALLSPQYEPDPGLREPLLARARFYRGTFALSEALDGLRDGDQLAYARGIEPYV